MGQKVNPTGFRTGITIGWKSRWFAPKSNYGEFLSSHSGDEQDENPLSALSYPTPALNISARYHGRYGNSMTDVMAARLYTESMATAEQTLLHTLVSSPVTPQPGRALSS